MSEQDAMAPWVPTLATPELEPYVAMARANYADPSNDDIEIDDHPAVSDARKESEGVWVNAWVWVATADLP